MTTKETEIEFCLSGLPRQVNGKGEVLPAIGYCTKITRHKVKREVEGEIITDIEEKHAATNYDEMLKQILNKYNIN